jgi:transglutaminase-like putative cysteine protease
MANRQWRGTDYGIPSARGRTWGRFGNHELSVGCVVKQIVAARLTLNVIEPAEVMLQIAAAHPTRAAESLTITADNTELQAVEVVVPGPGRVHRFKAERGRVDIVYNATMSGSDPSAVVSAADEISYLRPSRYAESDRLTAMAQAEFAGIERHEDLLPAISSWVGTRLSYVPGSSRPTDGAVETLLQRRGVCRDYAHLVIALLRSLDVPARLTSVYAPGLDPMDFHAVAEAAIEGRWYVVDATLLAPRKSLVRISTGRDAADTAFLSSYRGNVELEELDVFAVVDGELPEDNVKELVSLG